MRVFFKRTSALRAVCWVEVGPAVAADAKLIFMDGCILVDDLFCEEAFRRQGCASKIVEHLKVIACREGLTLKAYGIVNTVRARQFWAKHGVEDCFHDYDEFLFNVA